MSTSPRTAHRSRIRLGRVTSHGSLIVLSVFSLFPIYWMFATSLRLPNDIFSGSVVPHGLTLENYRYVWTRTPVARMLLNTFAMALLVTLGQVFTSVLASYAFARWRFPGDRVLFLVFLGTWLIPFQVTMIPNYVLVARLGWLNSLAGLVMPQLASAFAIILLRQHMKAFPAAVLDAARIDGASSCRISAPRSPRSASCCSSRRGTSISGPCS